jgi:predicted RNA-binding protein associated with RNAse of E/G family
MGSYVDLEVDICILFHNTVEMVGEDELDKAVAKGWVSQRLATFVMDKARIALKNLQDASTAKEQNNPQ